MKKIILALLICVLCAPALLIAGCKNKPNNQLNLSVYFENKVKYNVYSKSAVEVKLNDFSHNKHNDQVQYTTITFTGKPSWLYKMTLEKISFDIFSSANVEDFQFKVIVSNLADGDSDLVSSNTVTKEISVNLSKNQATHVKVNINDIFSSVSATTTIKITFDSAYYVGDYKPLDLKIDVMNFKVFGEHK